MSPAGANQVAFKALLFFEQKFRYVGPTGENKATERETLERVSKRVWNDLVKIRPRSGKHLERVSKRVWNDSSGSHCIG